MYIGLHVSERYPCQMLIKYEYSLQIFEKSSNVKFHKNPSNGSRVVPCGQADGPIWGNLKDNFCNFVNAHKIKFSIHSKKSFSYASHENVRIWGLTVPLCSFLSLVNITHKPIYF